MSERETHASEGAEPADWLGAWVMPAARPEFRAGLRKAFVHRERVLESREPELGSPADPAEAAETGDMGGLENELAPYLDELDAPPAHADFVNGLRDEFLGGPSPVQVPRTVPGSARRLSRRWRLLVGSLAAAAAAWLFLARPFSPFSPLAPLAPPAPVLRIVPGSYASAAVLSVDGVTLGDLTESEIDARLSGASTIATGESSARFRFDDHFVVELGAHSRLTWVRDEELPGHDARRAAEGARDFVLRSERGSMRVATGPAFEGSRMIVEAPFLDVEVVGTVFGIDVFDDVATCLCCVEGAVEVHPKVPGREAHRVVAGYTSLVGPEVGHHKEIPREHGDPLEHLALFWK